MANLIRSLTRKQLTNRNISTLSHHNPFFSSGSSLDPNLSSGFGLFVDGVGLNPSNEGFRVNEKVTHFKRLGFDPFFSYGSFLDLNLTSGFGLSHEESKFGNGVGFGLNPTDKGFRGNDEVDSFKRLNLDPFSSTRFYLEPNLVSGFTLSRREGKCGDGFGLNPSNEGLDPGLTYVFGLSQVIGSWKDDVEDPGMMWADSVKKKRKKKMNKHKYKKLRKRLRRKTKT